MSATVYSPLMKGVISSMIRASASVKPSHVLTAMGRTEKEAKETVRISFGRQNTTEEADEAAKIFVEVVKSLRKN